LGDSVAGVTTRARIDIHQPLNPRPTRHISISSSTPNQPQLSAPHQISSVNVSTASAAQASEAKRVSLFTKHSYLININVSFHCLYLPSTQTTDGRRELSTLRAPPSSDDVEMKLVLMLISVDSFQLIKRWHSLLPCSFDVQ
jgi:hypothetical protein